MAKLYVPSGSLVVVATRLPHRVEQVHRPALEARVTRIEHAVAIQVVVDRAGEGHELEVAEEQAGRRPPLDGRDRVGAWSGREGLDPAGLQLLLDRVGAWADVGEAVVAVGVGHRRGDDRAGGVEQVDGPSRQARLTRIQNAVAGKVVELLTADGDVLEVAEDGARRPYCPR